jgi:hypothetical protein
VNAFANASPSSAARPISPAARAGVHATAVLERISSTYAGPSPSRTSKSLTVGWPRNHGGFKPFGALSSSAERLQRNGGASTVDLGDRGVNAAVEVVEVEDGLVGEEVAFEVPPIALDVVKLRRVLG